MCEWPKDQGRLLQATDTTGLCPNHGQARSSATPISFAARAGVEAINALTFQLDHSVVADQLEGLKEMSWLDPPFLATGSKSSSYQIFSQVLM